MEQLFLMVFVRQDGKKRRAPLGITRQLLCVGAQGGHSYADDPFLRNRGHEGALKVAERQILHTEQIRTDLIGCFHVHPPRR